MGKRGKRKHTQKPSMKNDAHELMRLMWKTNKEAYIWLEVMIGYEVHFAELDTVKDYNELRYILDKLSKRALKKGLLVNTHANDKGNSGKI